MQYVNNSYTVVQNVLLINANIRNTGILTIMNKLWKSCGILCSKPVNKTAHAHFMHRLVHNGVME